MSSVTFIYSQAPNRQFILDKLFYTIDSYTRKLHGQTKFPSIDLQGMMQSPSLYLGFPPL